MLTVAVVSLLLIIGGILLLWYWRQQQISPLPAVCLTALAWVGRHVPLFAAKNNAGLIAQDATGRSKAALMPNIQSPLRVQNDNVARLVDGLPELAPMISIPRVQIMPVPLRICASTDSTILAAPRQRPDSYSNPVVENTALAAGSLSALCAKELQKRLPLLLQAVAIGDTVTVHMESHAMRGVAANFGLATLAESLLLIEVSGGAKRVDELRVLAQTLPSDVDAAIEALLRRDA